ncbi:MAG TPA: alpha/beta family hydrolase [Polyangia bacterium]
MAGSTPLILFAPGAGASSASRWMTAWAERLRAFGTVVPLDYPYMKAGKKVPDRLPVLIEAHRAALVEAQRVHGDHHPVVLAGKSMGSRVGLHLANALSEEDHPPAAAICFGYPLRPIGGGALRTEVLLALTTPTLFLQGQSDPLCPLDELASVRAQMKAPTELLVVPGGNHSLEVKKRAAASAGRSQADEDQSIATAIAAFLRAHGVAFGS